MRWKLALALVVLASSGASAADLGASDATPTPPPATSATAARFGVAFDSYYVNEANNDEGTDSDGWNLGGNVDLALGKVNPEGWGGQFDLRGSLYANNHGGDGDWTQNYLTGAIHLYKPGSNGGLHGIFAGGGIADDTGDSDLSQIYWFAGLEGRRPSASGNAIYFAQIGYLDGNDEFNEGINQAGFARVGGRFFTKPNMSFMAAVSGAFGQQDNGDEANSNAIIGNLELEAEHTLGNGATSLFVSYQGTYVSFDGGEHNANFHDIMVGLRWRMGAADLRSAYEGPASLDLAPVDRWFALTANEVE